MKKSLLLFASMFILGASSISATTIDKVEVVTNASNPQKWEIIVYSGTTGAIIHQETDCFTDNTLDNRLQELSKDYYKDDVTFNLIGDC